MHFQFTVGVDAIQPMQFEKHC